MSRKVLPELAVTGAAASAVVRGHPWVFAQGLSQRGARTKPSTGEWVTLVTEAGDPLGRGIYDTESPLAVRVWQLAHAPIQPQSPTELLAERLRAAFGLRASLGLYPGTTAYRLAHGEGDRMPGLVIDRYADWAVVRSDGAAAAELVDRERETILSALSALGLTNVTHLRGRGKDKVFDPWTQSPMPDRVEVLEYGVPFFVDLAKGQKTGAFLDQRENRAYVRPLAKGCRALNLFSYAGGFSLTMALGGATSVTSVDIAHEGHRAAQASFELNKLPLRPHTFATSDAYAFLERAAEKGEKWDLIVCDPPSFAPSEKAKPKALTAYRRLHGLCAAVLGRAGTLCAASCSSHIHAEDFLSTLDDAALGRDDLRLIELRGAPGDHPNLPAFPEGRYLKFAVLRASG
jgi:23S rRNA (cytosine1962-C5)-methyltransferase